MNFFGYNEQVARMFWLRKGLFFTIVILHALLLSVALSGILQQCFGMLLEHTLSYIIAGISISAIVLYIALKSQMLDYWKNDLSITPWSHDEIEKLIKSMCKKLSMRVPNLYLANVHGVNSTVYEDKRGPYLVLTQDVQNIESPLLKSILLHALLQLKQGDGLRNASMFTMVSFLTYLDRFVATLKNHKYKVIRVATFPLQLLGAVCSVPAKLGTTLLLKNLKVFSMESIDGQCISKTKDSQSFVELLNVCERNDTIASVHSPYLWFDTGNANIVTTHPTRATRIQKLQRYIQPPVPSNKPVKLPEFAITSLRTINDARHVLHRYVVELYPNTPFDEALDIGWYKQIHQVWSKITIDQKIGMLFRAMHLVYSGSDVELKEKWNQWVAQHYQQLKAGYILVAWSLQQPVSTVLPTKPWALIPWLNASSPDFKWYSAEEHDACSLDDIRVSLMVLPKLAPHELNEFWLWLASFNVQPPLIQQALLIYIRRKKS